MNVAQDTIKIKVMLTGAFRIHVKNSKYLLQNNNFSI